MENFNFAMLEYKRPDLEAYRTKLIAWKNEVESAKNYQELRKLIFEIDCEKSALHTQYSIAYIRHTLDTRDEFYEAEITYWQNTLPTLGSEEVSLSEAMKTHVN